LEAIPLAIPLEVGGGSGRNDNEQEGEQNRQQDPAGNYREKDGQDSFHFCIPK
jgi:hypothetical protein